MEILGRLEASPRPNLEVWRLYQNGQETKYRAILYGGQMVAIVKSRYVLLPNEDAVEAMDKVASELKLEPYRTKATTTKLFRAYLSNKSYTVGEENVKLGLSMVNSIDGSLAFGVTGFTFREVCTNGAYLGYRRVVTVKQKHTRGLLVLASVPYDFLKTAVAEALKYAEGAIQLYNTLYKRKVTADLIEHIKKLTPKKYYRDALEVNNAWQCYNALTQAIWHTAKIQEDRRFKLLTEIHDAFEGWAYGGSESRATAVSVAR